MARPTRAKIERLDRDDPLRVKGDAFDVAEGLIDLDGNLLGVLLKAVAPRMAEVASSEWDATLIHAWNDHEWIDFPARVGDKIARLIGAPPGTVISSDPTSVNPFQILAAALNPCLGHGNFKNEETMT